MSLSKKPKRHRFPVEIISAVVWSYHRFSDSYRDVQERMLYRGIEVSHETIRSWCLKFGPYFRDMLQKRERSSQDKWHLDEMVLKISGKLHYAWRAVDADGHELDIIVQPRRG